jgi:hypothetical protein
MTKEELLVVLIEEAAEVIQAATKCLAEPGYGKNDEVLATEFGELLALAMELPLDMEIVELARAAKFARVLELRVRQKHGVPK